jgi:hypothetical protein
MSLMLTSTRLDQQQARYVRCVVTTQITRSWLLLFALCVIAPDVRAQQIGTQATSSYSDLYKRQLKRTHNTGVSARTYTINKQFAQNPNLSPYLNLSRRGGVTPNYQAYVKPEVARRQNARANYNKQSHPGRPAGAGGARSAAGGNPYYGKYYTNR